MSNERKKKITVGRLKTRNREEKQKSRWEGSEMVKGVVAWSGEAP